MKNPRSKGSDAERTQREGEEQQQPTWQDPGSIASDREGQEPSEEEQAQQEQQQQQEQQRRQQEQQRAQGQQ